MRRKLDFCLDLLTRQRFNWEGCGVQATPVPLHIGCLWLSRQAKPQVRNKQLVISSIHDYHLFNGPHLFQILSSQSSAHISFHLHSRNTATMDRIKEVNSSHHRTPPLFPNKPGDHF
jgi:hypothetical protein